MEKEKLKVLLWLDDVRNPEEGDWLVFSPLEPPFCTVWVKTYNEFTSYIASNEMPDGICFDHDLGMVVALKARAKGMSKRQSRRLKQQEKSGYDCAKWLVDYCMTKGIRLPLYNIQSANPVGKENIRSLLENYKKYVEFSL